jgi:hypothetical protein
MFKGHDMKRFSHALHVAACAAGISFLTGCASSLPDRVTAAERNIRLLDRNDAELSRSLRELADLAASYRDQLRRLEVLLGRQVQTNSQQEAAIQEALSMARESALVTRHIGIERLGDTPLIVVKP